MPTGYPPYPHALRPPSVPKDWLRQIACEHLLPLLWGAKLSCQGENSSYPYQTRRDTVKCNSGNISFNLSGTDNYRVILTRSQPPFTMTDDDVVVSELAIVRAFVDVLSSGTPGSSSGVKLWIATE